MFTKYVNNRVKQEERRFYTIHCSYQGFTFDEEEGKAEDESGEDEAEDSCSYTLDGSDESVGNEGLQITCPSGKRKIKKKGMKWIIISLRKLRKRMKMTWLVKTSTPRICWIQLSYINECCYLLN